MNNQGTKKLKELCITITDGSHYSPVRVESGIPMLSVKDMRTYGFDYSNCKKITEEEYEKMCKNNCHPQKNDILIAKDGSYLKQIFVVKDEKKEAILSSIGILKPNINIVDPYYIKYYLSSDFVKKEVSKKFVSGSALPRIILNNFKNIEIPYVDLNNQHKIVKILKAIDDKIETNDKIYKELEKLTTTIYNYWFLQYEFPDKNGKPYKTYGGKMKWNDILKREIPEEWTNGNLYDIAEFINGLPCQKYRPKNNEVNLPVIKIKEMHEGITKETEVARANIPEKNIINDGDILFSWSATLEVIKWVGGKGALNQHIFKVIPIKYEKNYTYMQLSQYVINFIRIAEARKTTMGHITTDHIKQSQIVLPTIDIVNNFQEKTGILFKKIIQANKENQELVKLKKFLLPLLMNGQVKFKD